MPSIEADFWAELAQIHAAYLHIGSETSVIEVVGIAKPEMHGSTILWVF